MESRDKTLDKQREIVEHLITLVEFSRVNFFHRVVRFVPLSPKSIEGLPLKTLSETQPEVIFKINVDDFSGMLLNGSKSVSDSVLWALGPHNAIYETTIAWPPFCVACLSDAKEYKVFEVLKKVPSRYITGGGRTYIDAKDRDTAQRICNAVFRDRYWLPIPFCEKHGKRKTGIDLLCPINDGKFTLAFGNPQYARLFCYLNPTLKGTYKSESCRKREHIFKKILYLVGIYLMFSFFYLFN